MNSKHFLMVFSMMAAMAILATGCVGAPETSEDAPAGDSSPGLSTQSCGTRYFCDLDAQQTPYTTLALCKANCENNANYCTAAWFCQ